MGDYCSKDLSSFYLDIIKDRLYVDASNSLERRSAQTVCFYILDTLTHLMAPILSFTAELISDHYEVDKSESIHLQKFTDIEKVWEDMLAVAHKGPDLATAKISRELEYQNIWNSIFAIRSALLKAIEKKREKGLIKHPLEAKITVNFNSINKDLSAAAKFVEGEQKLSGKSVEDFFKELMVVSQFIIADTKQEATDIEGLTATVEIAKGHKCPRCWKFEESSNKDGLCNRCFKIVS